MTDANGATVTALQRQCVRELASLRVRLNESEEENVLLRRKLATVTAHLSETTDELEQRSALFSGAAERADRLETQVADAKRALLTREMRIRELEQQLQTRETAMRSARQANDQWEHEVAAARDDVALSERQRRELHDKLSERTVEVGGWKTKLQLAMASMEDVRTELETARARETQLLASAATLKTDRSESERRWKAKVDKRDKAIVSLQQQLTSLRDAQAQVDTRAKAVRDQEAQWRSSEATQQLEKRRHVLALQDQLQRLGSELDKAKMHDMLAQRELCRLREELLLSESQRKTQTRRHEQQRKGKDKEMAFVWQKYVEAMASRGTPPPSLPPPPPLQRYLHGMR